VEYVDLREEPAAVREVRCREFYDEVYVDAFPRRDEAEGPDTWLPLLGADVPAEQPVVFIILARERGTILGGIVFEQYRESGCWLATYLAVRPKARHRGIASGLLDACVRRIERVAAPGWLLFAETEDPERIADPAERDFARLRLRILTALNMRRLAIDYIQPALAPDKRTLDDLLLLAYAPHGAPAVDVPAPRLAAFLDEFYRALHQAASADLARMKAQIARTQRVATVVLAP
jgi:GNAT superfamily N-acetyltransferase